MYFFNVFLRLQISRRAYKTSNGRGVMTFTTCKDSRNQRVVTHPQGYLGSSGTKVDMSDIDRNMKNS